MVCVVGEMRGKISEWSIPGNRKIERAGMIVFSFPFSKVFDESNLLFYNDNKIYE